MESRAGGPFSGASCPRAPPGSRGEVGFSFVFRFLLLRSRKSLIQSARRRRGGGHRRFLAQRDVHSRPPPRDGLTPRPPPDRPFPGTPARSPPPAGVHPRRGSGATATRAATARVHRHRRRRPGPRPRPATRTSRPPVVRTKGSYSRRTPRRTPVSTTTPGPATRLGRADGTLPGWTRGDTGTSCAVGPAARSSRRRRTDPRPSGGPSPRETTPS